MVENLRQCVKTLEENSKEVRDEARKVLLNICHNILIFPDDEKYREVRLNGDAIEKLLPAVGAMECLFGIGYVEDGERIFLPRNACLSKLETLLKLLSTTSENGAIPKSRQIKRHREVEKKPTKLKIFFDSIIRNFKSVIFYEDPALQKKARSVIPIERLEIATMTKIREIQKSSKLNNITNPNSSNVETELNAKDLFLVELLHWFKYEFFKWVNNPTCSVCSSECKYQCVVTSTDPRCSRIELYRCDKCTIVVGFPRYLHPEPLLNLRRGRCGEWASAFTLLCRALDYDARLVYDETDHVWTEIWSTSDKRWIHVDPCENVIDQPLMYERGWKKKLTYIIAHSKDEVQDVTWRYTRDQKAVLARRKICSERSLTQFLRYLSNHRQNAVAYTSARKEYVIKRSLGELLSMLHLPNVHTEDPVETYKERTSGSLAWRLARGEVTQGNITEKNHNWDICKYGETFELQYNIVKDMYNVVRNDGFSLEQKYNWLEGTNATEGGIIRKVEDDWKMVYLARSPQKERGRVKWSFIITNPTLCVDTFTLITKSEVFHGANVSWKIKVICNDNKSIVVPITDCNYFYTEELQEALKLDLIATLSGGQGECDWQHAQLFRQSLENTEELAMIINIQLRNRCG